MSEKPKRAASLLSFFFLVSPRKLLGTQTLGRLRDEGFAAVRALLARTRQEYRTETFEEAVERLELTDELLSRRRREICFQSRIWYLLTFGSLGYALWNALNGPLLVVFGSLIIAVMGAISGFVTAFRVHQIDCRELMGFEQFVRSPEGWIK